MQKEYGRYRPYSFCFPFPRYGELELPEPAEPVTLVELFVVVVVVLPPVVPPLEVPLDVPLDVAGGATIVVEGGFTTVVEDGGCTTVAGGLLTTVVSPVRGASAMK